MWIIRLVVLLGLHQPFAQVEATTYGYTTDNGPATWTGFCQNTSTFQSPIDIPYDYDHLHKVNDWLPFQWIHYELEPHKMYIENDGHSAIITIEPNDALDIPNVIQGNLPGTYQLGQIRFRWGDDGKSGSEHYLFGKQFDAEIQLIHFKTDCGNTLEDAIQRCDSQDALVSMAIFIKESGKDNKAFDSIIEGLRHITHQGNKTYIKPFKLSQILPKDVDEFFRYEGSMTYPDCHQNTIWTVFKNYVKMSKKQLKHFFKLATNENSTPGQNLINNYRPVQILNNRTIFYADLKLDCDDHGWKQTQGCEIYFKETKKELNFIESAHSCLGNHYSKTPYTGLIPVGKLRCLRNRFEYNSSTFRLNEDNICGRNFRVNAIKDNRGVWREYPTGNRVLFHHFPEFKTHHGGFGDTLVWDAFLNRLFIQSEYEKIEGLCYRYFQNECEHCDGFEHGHTCSDSGDCYENQCHCDTMFSGHACQLGPVPDKEVVIVGGSTTSVSSTMYNSLNEITCTIASYNQVTMTSTDQVCDYVFGRGICCGGIQSNTTEPIDCCMYYDGFTKAWIPLPDMPYRLIRHRSNVIEQKGRDYRWLIAGGLSENIPRKIMFWLYQDIHWGTSAFHWETISDELPEERYNHCQVQINDCEVAFIGGITGTDVVSTETVAIWNFEEHTWRAGPNLTTALNFPACGILRDRISFHKKVVIGCGRESPIVQIWDLETNEIYNSPHFCPDLDPNVTDEDGHFDELNDNYLVFTNTHGNVLNFDLENGFWMEPQGNIIATADNHYMGDSFVAPRGTVECLTNVN